MPLSIRKRDGKFCVVKEDDPDGESMGCHDTEGEAQKQITAINMNEVKRKAIEAISGLFATLLGEKKSI